MGILDSSNEAVDAISPWGAKARRGVFKTWRGITFSVCNLPYGESVHIVGYKMRLDSWVVQCVLH